MIELAAHLQRPDAQRRTVPPVALEALKSHLGERLSVAWAVREQHGRDESPFDVAPPDAVAYCESTDDVVQVIQVAAQHKVPVIPYGAGSSVEGQLLAVQGGISVDLSRMNQLIAVQSEDMTVTVQAGVTRMQLNREIKDTGLFFPIDPGADATIGGMVATRASGTNAVRYGTMRENVLGLTVVLASGEVIRTGTRAKKSSAGYDLTRLFVGSEGTLGVVIEVTLRLYPLPEAVSAAVCHFPSVDAAVRTTIAVMQMGVPIARCELLDARAVRAVNLHDRLSLRESPMLLLEFHGSDAGVKEQAEVVQVLADEHGSEGFEWATTPEARSRLWAARHHAYFACLQTRPGCRSVTTDACVPISRLSECIDQAIQDAEEVGLPYFVVGHVGDGNFHVAYLIDPNQPWERELAERMNNAVVARALEVGGTCTGEHGVGLHKQDFLLQEAGARTVALMRSIKQTLDPGNILNPGKIFLT